MGGLTDVAGLLVGHAADLVGLTGCTAVLCPAGAVAAVEVLGEEEREQLVVGWNATAVKYPKDLTWVQLFESQVARTPEAMALVCGDQRLSSGADEHLCNLERLPAREPFRFFAVPVKVQGMGSFHVRAFALLT